jgi:hypothetical protein
LSDCFVFFLPSHGLSQKTLGGAMFRIPEQDSFQSAASEIEHTFSRIE